MKASADTTIRKFEAKHANPNTARDGEAGGRRPSSSKPPEKTAADSGALEGGAQREPGSAGLTPLGRRVLAGYRKRFGAAEGRSKFMQAVKDGRIDPSSVLAEGGSSGHRG
jgi:hypothetical protein